jgi:hypothetical protein
MINQNPEQQGWLSQEERDDALRDRLSIMGNDVLDLNEVIQVKHMVEGMMGQQALNDLAKNGVQELINPTMRSKPGTPETQEERDQRFKKYLRERDPDLKIKPVDTFSEAKKAEIREIIQARMDGKSLPERSAGSLLNDQERKHVARIAEEMIVKRSLQGAVNKLARDLQQRIDPDANKEETKPGQPSIPNAARTPRSKSLTGFLAERAGSGNNDQNPFMVGMLMLLVGLIDPDAQKNASLVDLISKAFGFDEKDPEHKEYRELRKDIADNGTAAARRKHDFSKLDGKAARDAISAGAPVIGQNAPAPADLSDRQRRVMSVMDDASKTAGVSPKLMVGLWGYESSFGKNLKSNTGSSGDFQFTRATMAETIRDNGTTMAARLRARGLNNEADMVENVQRQVRGMNGDQIKAFVANARHQGSIDELRNSSEISTYAAAFYSKTVARQMKLNAYEEKNFGLIYAGYNIGVGNALEIKNGKVARGWEVDANSGVAAKATASQQLESYNRAIGSRANSPKGQEFLAMLTENSQTMTGTDSSSQLSRRGISFLPSMSI